MECRSDRLSWRGTLLPRPASGKIRPHQQRIPLKLPTTSARLRQIEREAKIIAAHLLLLI